MAKYYPACLTQKFAVTNLGNENIFICDSCKCAVLWKRLYIRAFYFFTFNVNCALSILKESIFLIFKFMVNFLKRGVIGVYDLSIPQMIFLNFVTADIVLCAELKKNPI